ncbi:helix-turn-helix domain-containing protein [Paenibacillus sp. FSL R7-0333]|uniref:helix-turn-helix domain-containing protein n=1 Tax=Paenibacillus sp. FSL R7-0333 TaxID=1926587 RepID=UPI0009FAEC6D
MTIKWLVNIVIKSKLHEQMLKHKVRNISELARVTELDRRTLTNIWDEKNKRIDYETLNKLCEHFNCNVGDLLEYIPD